MPTEEQLIEQYGAFVRGIAAQTRRQIGAECELEDLVACGFAGLIEAHRRFDPSRGVKFKSFAYYRVRGSVIDGLRKMAPLPRRAYLRMKAASVLDEEAEQTRSALGKNVEVLGVEGKLRNIDAVLGRVAAAYAVAQQGSEPGDGSEPVSNEPSPEERALESEQRSRTMALLNELSEREQKLVRGHLLEGRSLEDLGRELGISKSAASRAHGKALERMRTLLERAQ